LATVLSGELLATVANSNSDGYNQHTAVTKQRTYSTAVTPLIDVSGSPRGVATTAQQDRGHIL